MDNLEKLRELTNNLIDLEKEKENGFSRLKYLTSVQSPLRKYIYIPPYGDPSEAATSHIIRDAVGEDVLIDIVNDYLGLVETSSAIYEKNGDYAIGIFSSGYCQFVGHASYKLCGTEDIKEALSCGKWLCHESSWTDNAKKAILSQAPVTTECNGGINLYGIPIFAHNDVIGAMNVGYGSPPTDPKIQEEKAKLYGVSLEEYQQAVESYRPRSGYIAARARERLESAAKLIGEIVCLCRKKDGRN